MFCPNCGNNCGDARFCLSCGTKLPQAAVPATQSGEWKVGMPCPNCGATKLEGDCCAFCGTKLQQQMNHPKETLNKVEYPTTMPIGKFAGTSSSLTLTNSSLIVQNRLLFINYKTEIPYNEIVSVLYVHQDSRRNSIGYMIFRGQDNKSIPIPDEYRSTDKAAVVTPPKTDLLFYHIFCALKTLAPQSAQFTLEPVATLDVSVNDEYLDALFNEYSPFRDPAVEKLHKLMGVDKDSAKHLINKAFDERQQAIYDSDPVSAIRDLYCLLDKKEQEYQEAVQGIIQRREEQRQREMLAEAIERRLKK